MGSTGGFSKKLASAVLCVIAALQRHRACCTVSADAFAVQAKMTLINYEEADFRYALLGRTCKTDSLGDGLWQISLIFSASLYMNDR